MTNWLVNTWFVMSMFQLQAQIGYPKSKASIGSIRNGVTSNSIWLGEIDLKIGYRRSEASRVGEIGESKKQIGLSYSLFEHLVFQAVASW